MRHWGWPLSASTSGLPKRDLEALTQAQATDEPEEGLAPHIPASSPNGGSHMGGRPSQTSQVVPLPPQNRELPTLPFDLSRERHTRPSAVKTRQTKSFSFRGGKARQKSNAAVGCGLSPRDPTGGRDSHSVLSHAAGGRRKENVECARQDSDTFRDLHSGMVVGFGAVDFQGEGETSENRSSRERTSSESARHTWRKTCLPFTMGRDIETGDVRGKRHGGATDPPALGAGVTRAEFLRRQSDPLDQSVCRGLVHVLERLTELVCINDVDFVTIEQGEAIAKRRAAGSAESENLDESFGEWTPTDWRSLLRRPVRSTTMMSRWSLWGSIHSRRRSQPACRTLQMMSKALRPHNLMFVDRHFEEEFRYNVNRTCAERLLVVSAVFLFVSLCNYLCLLAGVSSGWYLQGRRLLITLHVCLALSIALCVLLLVVSSVFPQSVRQCAEQVIYWFVSGLNVAVTSFAIYVTTILFFHQLEPGEVLPKEHPVITRGPLPPPLTPAPDDKGDNHLVYVLLSVNIVEAVLSSYFFLMVVFLSHVIPGRIGITFWHQLALFLLQAVPSLIGLGRLSIFVWPFLIRAVATAVFLLVSLATNVCMEVKRRETFSTWLLIKKTAEASRQISGDARKNSIVSALDRVGTNCREAVTVLEQCKQNVTDIEVNAHITYVIDLISDSLELLTRCPNIYASHVDEKLREQVVHATAVKTSAVLGVVLCLLSPA